MSPSDQKKPLPIYSSWKTFTNALTSLSVGVPTQIDRSVFPGLNWAVQSQLLTGLRFLGLIDEGGIPSPELIALAEDEASRKELLGSILRNRYPEMFAIDLTKASPMQINQTMQQAYDVKGDTLEKALRFFISGAEFAGIPLSPLLRSAKKSTGTRKRRAAPVASKSAAVFTPDPEPFRNIPRSDGESRTIEIGSGGTLTISTTVKFLGMTSEDRAFVFRLIDELDAYEKRVQQSA